MGAVRSYRMDNELIHPARFNEEKLPPFSAGDAEYCRSRTLSGTVTLIHAPPDHMTPFLRIVLLGPLTLNYFQDSRVRVIPAIREQYPDHNPQQNLPRK